MTATVIGGWEPILEAGLRADAAVYDDPAATYDSELVVYDTDGQPIWVDLRCELLSVDCALGARPHASPGVISEAGRLRADFYDPEGRLDPTAGEFGMMLRPGAPVRVTARRADGSETRPIWTGTADYWGHDLLHRTGSLDAVDGVSRLAAIPVVAFARPAESTADRVAALLALAPDPPPLTITGTGRPLAACVLSGDLWQVLASVIETDQGSLLLGADGTLIYRPRDEVWPQPVAVLVDCPDDGPWDAVYTALSAVADEDLLVNVVEADRVRQAASGEQGPPGPAGPAGDPGVAGPQGPKGDTGSAGATGAQGPKGDTGSAGATGAQGPKGDPGAQGPAGAAGAAGPAGADSTVPGPQGPPGSTGATGAQGPPGAQGATGPAGADSTVPGPAGPKGDTGNPGATGPQGPKGDPGAASTVPGPKGDKGDTGPQGPPGTGVYG